MMLCTLIRLFNKGGKVQLKDIPSLVQYTGNLLLSQLDTKTQNGGYRVQAILHSHDRGTVPFGVIQPMYEVKVVRITDSQMLLRGIEFDSSDRSAIKHCLQEWLVKL